MYAHCRFLFQGFRGIASIFVVASHLSISFKPDLVFTPSPEAAVTFWHWPIIRTFAEGFPWVGIFFVLSGYVNALKPIKLMRNDQRDSALSGLATSALRRSLRLILPCTIITFLTWIMAQFGAFQVGKAVNSHWLSSTSPAGSPTTWQAVKDLAYAYWSTWVGANNYYDMNQWSMMWFLKGSMTLYLVLVAVSRVTPTARMIIIFMLFSIYWKLGDGKTLPLSSFVQATDRETDMVGIPTYGGIFFAELSMFSSITSFATNRTIFSKALTVTLLIAGLFLLSFPNSHPEWTPWFNPIVEFGKVFYPAGSNQFSITCYIGTFMILLAVMLSTTFQWFLVRPIFLWLGKISFPLYLLHGPLLRSFLCWILYAGIYPRYEEQPTPTGAIAFVPVNLDLPSGFRLVVCLPVYFAVVLGLSHVWTEKVEPRLGRFTKFIEDWAMGNHTFSFSASWINTDGYTRLDNGSLPR